MVLNDNVQVSSLSQKMEHIFWVDHQRTPDTGNDHAKGVLSVSDNLFLIGPRWNVDSHNVIDYISIPGVSSWDLQQGIIFQIVIDG
jgi:hypothetical protein